MRNSRGPTVFEKIEEKATNILRWEAAHLTGQSEPKDKKPSEFETLRRFHHIFMDLQGQVRRIMEQSNLTILVVQELNGKNEKERDEVIETLAEEVAREVIRFVLERETGDSVNDVTLFREENEDRLIHHLKTSH